MTKSAQPHMDSLHQAYNAKDFSGIYKRSGSGLKAGCTEKEFTNFLKFVHATMGEAGSSTVVGTQKMLNTQGERLTIYTLNTHFAQGEALEILYMRNDDGKLALHRYEIRSDRIMKRLAEKLAEDDDA